MARRVRRGSLPSTSRLTAVLGGVLLAAHGGWAVAPPWSAAVDMGSGEPSASASMAGPDVDRSTGSALSQPLVVAAKGPGTATLATPFAPLATVAARSPARTGPATPSEDVRLVHASVVRSGDAGRAPFVIVDKRAARLWLYEAGGRPLGSTPVLLGSARGDHTVPGVGDKPLEALRPEERTTPAGRFVAMSGMSARGEQVWWVDYDAAVSIHRVLTTRPAERRQARLESPSIADNRISAGCINLPRPFYETVLHPALEGRRPIVYVLPETREVRAWLAQLAPHMARQLQGARRASLAPVAPIAPTTPTARTTKARAEARALFRMGAAPPPPR